MGLFSLPSVSGIFSRGNSNVVGSDNSLSRVKKEEKPVTSVFSSVGKAPATPSQDQITEMIKERMRNATKIDRTVERSADKADIIIPKYTEQQITDIVNLCLKRPEIAKVIDKYLYKESFLSPEELLNLLKTHPEAYKIAKEKGIIFGCFDFAEKLATVKLKHISKNPMWLNLVTIQRFDELATKSPKNARMVDSILNDKRFVHIYDGADKNDSVETVDKFLELYSKSPEFCKDLMSLERVSENVRLAKGLDCLKYLTNVLDQIYQMEEKGIDKNKLLNEMKPLFEQRYSGGAEYDKLYTLDYVTKRNQYAMLMKNLKDGDVKTIYSLFEKIERQNINPEIVEKIVKDGNSDIPKSTKEVYGLLELYTEYPDKEISKDFAKYYTENQEYAKEFDLWKTYQQEKV